MRFDKRKIRTIITEAINDYAKNDDVLTISASELRQFFLSTAYN